MYKNYLKKYQTGADFGRILNKREFWFENVFIAGALFKRTYHSRIIVRKLFISLKKSTVKN